MSGPQPCLSTPKNCPFPVLPVPQPEGPVFSVAFLLIFPPFLWPQTFETLLVLFRRFLSRHATLPLAGCVLFSRSQFKGDRKSVV